VILFIDELHTIVGAGGAEGAIDASNILKPALARGEIRLIGATTLDEYRESIERDKALERRFQPVNVPEPDEKECCDMLLGIKARYENYHNVSITDDAIKAAVSLSKRYIADRYLPDKAIDLIDEAAANLKMNRIGRKTPILTESEIAKVAETRTGIPVTDLNSTERERLKTLETNLKKYVIGQDEAITSLCKAVRRTRIGIRNEKRPNGSFLFIGRAGVGKTECAKALAKAVFYNEKSFIRLDMSEFSEPHSVSKIIGSPPGYVGFGEGGALTERVRRNPYSLILFDEIEKAHSDVRALLLQLLDEGTLTDSSGLTVSFDNTIVIMTANCGQGSGGIGFGNENSNTAKTEAARILAPELVDRVDEIIMFRSLEKEELQEVAKRRLDAFCAKLRESGMEVEIASDFAFNVVEYTSATSARAVSRMALRLAEEALSDILLDHTFENGETVTLCAENQRGVAKIKQKNY
ncbi:MAG: ATP-dependent Clp protease ATP-binding subunit, partial [Clostridia bacterium]|nr:ATP-dependent Clp protease ATP-binding subunit [Clostridia bacterium]